MVNQMMIAVTEIDYRGILLQRVEDQGWKFTIDDKEYMFPSSMDAQHAIDEIYQFIEFFVAKHKGVKLPKQKKI